MVVVDSPEGVVSFACVTHTVYGGASWPAKPGPTSVIC